MDTHRSCRTGVWTKLPPVIPLNPVLTNDLKDKREDEWKVPQSTTTIKLILGCGATYSETTSGGKVWGTDLTFSHRALSLVQVHPKGHLGCLTLHPSADIRLTATTRNRSVRPLHPLPGSPIPSVPVDNRGHATSRKNNPLQCLVNIKASWWCTNTFFCLVSFDGRGLCRALMQTRGSALRVWLGSSGLVLRGLHMRDRRARHKNTEQCVFCFFFHANNLPHPGKKKKKTKLAVRMDLLNFSALLKFLETEDCSS